MERGFSFLPRGGICSAVFCIRIWNLVQQIGPAVIGKISVDLGGNLAVGHLEGIRTSDIEGRRGGVSYMIDTLRELHANRPDVDWTLIMGNDAARDLDSWHEAAELRTLCRIAVVARGGQEPDPGDRMVRIAMPRIDVSASEIRRRIATGLSVEFLTPVAVADYIHAHRLYLTE